MTQAVLPGAAPKYPLELSKKTESKKRAGGEEGITRRDHLHMFMVMKNAKKSPTYVCVCVSLLFFFKGARLAHLAMVQVAIALM